MSRAQPDAAREFVELLACSLERMDAILTDLAPDEEDEDAAADREVLP